MHSKLTYPTIPDYYPFGTVMTERSWSDGYRYGFNGMETDKEGAGGGLSTYDYGFRIYNPTLGRFLSLDPLIRSYPWNSPYSFAENRVIDGVDLDGLEFVNINRHTVDGVTVQLNINKRVDGSIGAPLNPTVTETETTHRTNPAGQIVTTTQVPTSVNQTSAESSTVMNDVNGAGAATTQGRLATVPRPIPLNRAQAVDQGQLAQSTSGNNWPEMQNTRVPVYNQFNSALSITNTPNFANSLTAEINMGNINGTGLSTTLPGNVSRIMLITDGNPANVANAQAQIDILNLNSAFQGISFALVNDPVMIANLNALDPTTNPNSVVSIFNPTSDAVFFGQQLGRISGGNYAMPFTSNSVPDANGMTVEPRMNTQGLQDTTGNPIE